MPVYKYAVGALQETCATDRPARLEENVESVQVEITSDLRDDGCLLPGWKNKTSQLSE